MKGRRERETTPTAVASPYIHQHWPQGVVKRVCLQMTLKAIVSARLSCPILGVGTTMVHWKMEHGSHANKGEDRYGRGSSRPWASAAAKWYGAALKGGASKHPHAQGVSP
jgi:hypothetical protein